MIRSFADKETERVWFGDFSKKLPHDIQHVARRKLRMPNNAVSLDDLRVPAASRLEALKGQQTGSFSIRINRQWRIRFTWLDGNAGSVQIVDYH